MEGYLDLPVVLQNMVMLFAYETHASVVKREVELLLSAKAWRIPTTMLKMSVFSFQTRTYVASPLLRFIPLTHYGDFRKLINWDAVFEELWSFDFRRTVVRCWGPRNQWIADLTRDWRNLGRFILFWNNLIHKQRKGDPVYRPSYGPNYGQYTRTTWDLRNDRDLEQLRGASGAGVARN